MGNNQPSARKKTYYISLAISRYVLHIRIRIMGQFHTDSILPYFLRAYPF